MKLHRLFDYSNLVMWAGLALVVLVFVLLVNENSQSYQLRSKASELERKNSQLQDDIEQLNYRIAYYNTDEYKERIAREKLGLQQPGESVVIVPRQAGQSTSSERDVQSDSNAQPQKSNFTQWMDFLFGGNSQG